MGVLQVVGFLLNVGALICSSLVVESSELVPATREPLWTYAPEPQNSKDLPSSTWIRRSLSLSSLFSPVDTAEPFHSTIRSHMPLEPSLHAEAPESSSSPPNRQKSWSSVPETGSPTTPENDDTPKAVPPRISFNTAPKPAPNPKNHPWHPNSAHHRFAKLAPIYSPVKSHHPKAYNMASAPMIHTAPLIAPSLAPVSGYTKGPVLAPLQISPSPDQHRQKDCMPLTCSKPLAYSPTESSCHCVLPMQVALRLSVSSYVLLSMIPELSAEIAAGVFMKQSQVRITDANASPDNTEKTIVGVNLLPVGEKIDDYTAYLIFHRFWSKKVDIKASFFGDYDVLYVQYPGLPTSPSSHGVISSNPYSENNTRSMEPLGVDVRGKQHKHGFRGSLLTTIVISCSVSLILISAVAWVLLLRHRSQPYPSPPTTIQSMVKSSGIELSNASRPSSPSFSFGSGIASYMGSARKFSSREIERATDSFDGKRIVGEGGFGRVYSGVLEDGMKVAVKILKRFDRQSSREFLAEVEMLSRLHHRNLVKLIGICMDRMHCLVYELIPNGSLESHLHGIDKERSPLNWNVRLKIALGAARALTYLHEDSSPHVIHRDFKASNILLEDDFTAKVSDFGLARTALDQENRHISTRVMGTFGYVAPEYAMTGHLLVKSDVYSYGVVLLELLTGRTPVDMSHPPGEENLVSWARPLLTTREGLEAMVDQSLGPDFPFDSLAKVAAIASMCVQPEVSNRPFMGEVVQALKLVCNESGRMLDSPSRHYTHSDRTPAACLLSPSPVHNYDYLLELERDLTMSELLASPARFGDEDDGNELVRRYSSSGPLKIGKRKALWKTMREFKRSMSEHGRTSKLWPGSH